MKIEKVNIKNFRGIEEIQDLDLNSLSILIGENGVAKTALLEALNFCLSPSFLSDRMNFTDFYQGTDDPIEIQIKFDTTFNAFLPDGFTKQTVVCDGIFLRAKKRDKAKAGKMFTELVVTQHYVLPNRQKDSANGWVQKRKNGSDFRFDERLLSFPVQTEGLPRSFYFSRTREKQIKKGFRTSIETVIEDFNWRFQRNIRNSNPASSIPVDKTKVETDIIDTIDKKLIKKTFDSLNNKLQKFNVPTLELKILDSNAPFNNMFLSKVINNVELQTNQIGSGIELLVSLVFLETLATLSKEDIIILIDEPELHLHPKLQKSLIPYFDYIINSNQIICTTHSPYVYQDCVNKPNTELTVCTKDGNDKISFDSVTASNLFPWSPSWGEINYKAFGLPTVEFHNELYGHLQWSNNAHTTNLIEAYFIQQGQVQTKNWIKVIQGIPQPATLVTLMTYIRHKIHHPENLSNVDYTETELIESIEIMMRLV
ncbi:ATP-dependent nuclease [Hyunsoonleella rubra]|uniref:ATP-dependent endonuclease n=1 Tax=Hyunsoonleella rubra TaxID=1737062 RepID=A0ABW5TDY2_9FLAO